ncbi:MAG: Fic family protein [Magnetococcus sp. YQC-5]
MQKYVGNDHYLDKRTMVLKNKLGIHDQAILEKYEADYVTARAYELAKAPLDGHFDLAHLQAIHRFLFNDVYAWAGEIRDIDLSIDTTYFANHFYIISASHSLFEKLAGEGHLIGMDATQFSERSAYYLGEINAIHPFREGNGRTQREFINHLAYKNGFKIAWMNITREDMVTASIESFRKENITLLKKLIFNNIYSIDALVRL